MILKIMALGDVVGDNGCAFLSKGSKLYKLKTELGAHLVVANGENSASGNGISALSANSLFDSGVDIITGGNHIFKNSASYPMLDDSDRIVRPANYPGSAPGQGFAYADVMGYRVLVFNLLGNAFMPDTLASPFECADKILDREKGNYDISVLDIHAEATSEKLALARYLDGRVSVVFGTHTHIPTADASVLRRGTGYITDLGMCGSTEGVLGVREDCIIHKFTEHTPCRFKEATGGDRIMGALFSVDTDTGGCSDVKSFVI